MRVKDDGKGNLTITCTHCGKPISKTSRDFGMDCEDDCSRKAYERGKTMKEIYFSMDIETDGPIPGEFSMLSFGVVALTEEGHELDTFEANLERLPKAKRHQDTMDWWTTQPEAWAALQENKREPKQAIPAFVSWVDELSAEYNCAAVAVCYPAAFDFTFMLWYMHKFAFKNPFDFRCIDVRSFVMAHKKTHYVRTGKKYWPNSWFPQNANHTHVAIDDAREQGLAFINIMKGNRE